MSINKFLLWVVVVLVLIVIGLFAWNAWGKTPTYYAVYLTTGDLYFGRLVHFPYFGLKQVYLLQLTQNATAPVSVQRFANVFWGPQDSIRLNKDQVVWMTKLDEKSQLADIIRTNPTLSPTSLTPSSQGELPQRTPPSPQFFEESSSSATSTSR